MKNYEPIEQQRRDGGGACRAAILRNIEEANKK